MPASEPKATRLARRSSRRPAWVCPALVLSAASSVLAQPAIRSFTIDCGGEVSASGTLRLTGSIGQPDAGPGLAGGTATLRGGFLAPRLCAADFDASGTRDVADIFAFLSAWFASGPGADFDNSGVRDVADIFSFLSTWFAGC